MSDRRSGPGVATARQGRRLGAAASALERRLLQVERRSTPIARRWPRRSTENRTWAGQRSAFCRSRRPLVPTWVNRAVVGCQEIASRHVEIAVVDKAAVALDQDGAIEAIEFRDLIPGQPAAQVMRSSMEVVEQEK